jgi:1-acyl-sn-glycerol-3-phosphate acyltransferase
MNRFYRFIRGFFGGLFRLVYRVKVIGKENEVLDKPYIVCANHTSLMDVVVLVISFKGQIRFMAKKEIFSVPILRSFVKAMGAFPVDRKKGDVAAIKKTLEILKDGDRLGIFPQGTRRPYENPRDTEVKDGVGMIASRSGVGVMPVYIKTKKGKLRLFRKTRIIIGEYISPEELTVEVTGRDKYKAVTEKIFDRVCALGENTEVKW